MRPSMIHRFLALALLGLLAGCKSMTPGDLTMVQPNSEAPYAGNVYLLRGFIGIWSYGIDHLGEKINAAGIRANVYQEDQWRQLCDTIIEKYKDAKDPEPLVLIGHSYGADDALRMARRLEENKVHVELVITLDPVTPPKAPKGVGLCYNIYQPNFLDSIPVFRGIALEAEDPASGNLVNVNMRAERQDLLEPGTDHFNIEKNPHVHDEVVRKLREHCPPRQDWLAQRQAMRYSAAGTSNPPPAPLAAPAPVPGTPRVGATETRLDRVP
jgi:pimeloyl-ACP methyl ester carboxylesterase